MRSYKSTNNRRAACSGGSVRGRARNFVRPCLTMRDLSSIVRWYGGNSSYEHSREARNAIMGRPVVLTCASGNDQCTADCMRFARLAIHIHDVDCK